MHQTLVRSLVLFAAFGGFAAPALAQPTWNFTYQDVVQSTGFGFADPTSGQLRRETVTAVTGYLSTIIDARGTINFEWDPSLNQPGSGVLASGGTSYSLPSGATLLVGNVYRQAVGNTTSGTPGFGQVNFGRSWFATGLSGTGTPGGSEFDLFSVVLHELAHSMHFASVFNADGSSQFGAGIYTRYDGFTYRGATGANKLLNEAGTTFQGTSADLVSNDVYWNGTFGVAANGGTRVKLYAPSTYSTGSSISHIDEATYTTATMTPSIAAGQTARQFSGREIGIMLDLGWNNFEWNNTSGNWTDGTTSMTSSRWQNSAIQNSDKRILAPVGTITHNLVLTFGGSTAYTSTNDLAATFLLNRLILNGTASSASTIAGAVNSKLEFGFDNGFTVTPQIEQRNTGAFNVTSDIHLPNGLLITDAAQANPGQVDLGGVVSGVGGLTKAGGLTLRLSGSSANTYTGLTTVSAGILLLNKTPGQNALAGSATLTGNSQTGIRGTLRLGAADQMPESGTITLAGGILSTGQTTGFSDVVGAFEVTADSTIALGTGVHTLQFTGFLDNTLVGVLTVTGWTGVQGLSGESGRILVSGVTGDPNTTYSSFLSTVQFQGYSQSAAFLPTQVATTWELVPVPEPGAVLAIGFAGLWIGTAVTRRVRRKPLE